MSRPATRWTFGFSLFLLLFNATQPGLANAADQASKLLAETGISGGFVVHLGANSSELAVALGKNKAIQVHGLVQQNADVSGIRQEVHDAGLYGEVSFDRMFGSSLPYVDNLVNLLIAEVGSRVSRLEIMRVLVPNGQALLKNADGTWDKITKPRPENIDEWSHYLHDAISIFLASVFSFN